MANFFVTLGAIFVSLWMTLCSFLPIGSIKMTTGPAVFDCGDENYAVVWATSAKGSGYVKYTYEGEEKVLWDEVAGNIKSDDTIHSVIVPKKELQGNDYVVGSQYVGYKFGYNAGLGKTVESEVYSFRGTPKEDGIKFLSISDIHYMENKMHQSLSYFENEEIDFVVMLGDITSTLETKDMLTDNFFKDAADISKGVVPIVYTRGNHETRGEISSQLLRYIPTETDGFYYTFEFGSLGGIVIDSGEDKEDSHPEYSGLVNFEKYRKDEYKWLTGIEKSEFENSRYKIAFSHMPKLKSFFGQDWTVPLKNLEADLIIGGHHHRSQFIQEEGEIPVLIDGGKINGSSNWATTMVTLENGKIHMLTVDNEGNTLLDETISAE